MLRKHYHWVIAAMGVLVYAFVMGLCNPVLALYLPFIEDWDGISDSAGSAIFTVRCLMSFLSTFVVLQYYNRISLRKGVTLTILLTALGVAVMGIGGSVWIYYIGAAVLGVGYGMSCMVPVALLLKNWFRRKLGFANGLCSAGSGVSMVIFSPVVEKWITRYSLRTAFWMQAALIAGSALLFYLLVRDTPAEMGLEKFGEETPEEAAPARETAAAPAAGKLSRPLGHGVLALLAVMMVLNGGVSNSSSGHQCILFTTCGYSPDLSALALSVYGVLLTAGKLSAGVLCDRLGGRRAGILFILLFCLGCLPVLGMNGRHAFWMWALVILTGFGSAMYCVCPQIWAAEIASPAEYPGTYRWMQLFHNLGGILLTLVPGFIADHTGEYRSSFLLFIALMAAETALLQRVYKIRCGPGKA